MKARANDGEPGLLLLPLPPPLLLATAAATKRAGLLKDAGRRDGEKLKQGLDGGDEAAEEEEERGVAPVPAGEGRSQQFGRGLALLTPAMAAIDPSWRARAASRPYCCWCRWVYCW